ncbi:unnamed protein product, partial [marine sediment metagenome]
MVKKYLEEFYLLLSEIEKIEGASRDELKGEFTNIELLFLYNILRICKPQLVFESGVLYGR